MNNVQSCPEMTQDFRFIGGAWQPIVENFEQLKAVLELDEAWFAITGIDITSLRADQKFLAYLDSDKNGKIRTDEIKDAIKFMAEVLKDGSGFEQQSRELLLEALNTDVPAGSELLATAKQILCNLGKADSPSIALTDVSNEKQIKNCVLCNGDGIITPDSVDEKLAGIINLAIKQAGAETDLSGAAGINAKRLDDFTAAAKALLEKAPEFDVLISAEAKGIPLVYEMARQAKSEKYVVARKASKLYMRNVVSVKVNSITTDHEQMLCLDFEDASYMKGKRVLIVDDVISTGESLKALEHLVSEVGGIICGKMTVLAEGEAADRDDIIYLEKLPLFDKDGNVLE